MISFDSALPQEQGGHRLFRFDLTASQAFDDAGCFDSTAPQAFSSNSGRTLIVAGSFDSTASQALRFSYSLG